MSLTSEQLISNWQSIRLRIDAARGENNTALLAVSKTKPTWMIQALYDAGQRDFGENYLQDALPKIELLSGCSEIRWHYIGQIQSNKTRDIAMCFDWVHSVDRIKIARRLNEQRPADLAPLNICLQVNLDDESQKGGVSTEELPMIANEIAGLPNLKLRGLMCIPKPKPDFEQQKASFEVLANSFNDLKSSGLPLDTLSMGMSGDLEAAIAAGSTMVRVGTDIFGQRTQAE